MDIADFYALQTGSAPLGTGAAAKLTVRDLGNLRVPSGKVGACDPFVSLSSPLVVQVPSGDYPVRVTIADVTGPRPSKTELAGQATGALRPAYSHDSMPNLLLLRVQMSGADLRISSRLAPQVTCSSSPAVSSRQPWSFTRGQPEISGALRARL